MPNGHETSPEPEIIRIRERLAELDQSMFDEVEEEHGELESEYSELQEHHRQLTGDYYELPKDRDV